MHKKKSQNDPSAAKKNRPKKEEVQGRAGAVKRPTSLTTVPRDEQIADTTVPRDSV
jgi:hypothetical protein